MTNIRLKITKHDFSELQRLVLADMPIEAAAFGLVGISKLQDRIDIIVRRIVEIPKELVDDQSEYHLRIRPQAINGLIALCESNGLSVLLCHSHPENLRYSPSDDFGEERIVKSLQQSIPPGAPIASLLISKKGITGRIWLPNNSKPKVISEIIIIDRSIQRIYESPGSGAIKIDELYNRQVLAFGIQGQDMISRTRVGIVGVGGTGSPVVEQLVRLGVNDLVLIDPDIFDKSNLSRVYGTYFSSVKPSLKGKTSLKVDLVAMNLKKINPRVRIRALPKNVVISEAARTLLDRDIVFLCKDDHWGRSIVNQIAYQYYIPVINLGVRIASKDGKITEGIGTVDILRPDKSCLWCNQFLKADLIATESLPYQDRSKLQLEGYVENLETKTPSVVSITTTVAGMGVTLFLQMTTDFMGTLGDINRINYDAMSGIVRRGTTNIQEGCICKKVKGFGDFKPLPTLPNLEYLEKSKDKTHKYFGRKG